MYNQWNTFALFFFWLTYWVFVWLYVRVICHSNNKVKLKQAKRFFKILCYHSNNALYVSVFHSSHHHTTNRHDHDHQQLNLYIFCWNIFHVMQWASWLGTNPSTTDEMSLSMSSSPLWFGVFIFQILIALRWLI